MAHGPAQSPSRVQRAAPPHVVSQAGEAAVPELAALRVPASVSTQKEARLTPAIAVLLSLMSVSEPTTISAPFALPAFASLIYSMHKGGDGKAFVNDTHVFLTHGSQDDAGEPVARQPRSALSPHHRRVQKPASSQAGQGSRFRVATSTATAACGLVTALAKRSSLPIPK